MITLHSKASVFVDVDDTLLLWAPSQEQLEKFGIDIECPESTSIVNDEVVTVGKWVNKFVPHLPHIEDIKRHKARGHLVCVWSAGGSEWAETAVKALKLEKYVDLVIAKPTWVIDDLEPNQFLKRVPFKEAQK